LAGTDILEKPADPDAMIRGLKAAVQSGRISQERLNASVRKILAWKYELGIAKQKITPIDEIDRIVGGPESAGLTNEIAERAITLVRNESGALPLDRNARVALLGISNGFDGPPTMAPLRAALAERGVRLTSGYIQENSSPDDVAAARKVATEADVVVVGLYGRVRSGAKNSVGVPENGAAVLREALAAGKKVIGVSFGNPYILGSFPGLKTYVVSYGDMPSLQRATARALLGETGFYGHLPISLPGLHTRGTSLRVRNN
jgi:beta-N-acetylhexosaminidase